MTKLFQIILKNDQKTGLIDYRRILSKEKLKLIPRKDSDGLNIFIMTNIETTYILKNKFNWILDILKCSKPIKIPVKKITKNKKVEIKSSNPKTFGN